MRMCIFCGRPVEEEAAVCEHCRKDLPAETVALEMPLCYDHTCNQCGTVTTVSDTFYWQKVRCPGCGQEFIASPPMGGGP